MPADGKNPEKWSSEDKFAIVLEASALNEAELAGDRRQRSLYAEQIEAWRKVCLQADACSATQARTRHEQTKKDRKQLKKLERALHRKEQARAEAAALLVLQKSSSQISGELEQLKIAPYRCPVTSTGDKPMFDKRTLSERGGWAGYRVAELEYRPGEGWMGRGKLLIRLEPRGRVMRCSRCGRPSHAVHDTTLRRVRDLPILDWDVVLIVPRRRLWCGHCGGPHLEALDWLSPHRRVTRRLEAAIGRLARMLPLKQVAALYGVGWHTVKAIDKACLAQEVSAPDWRGIEYLGMDEFALHRGHRYATVVVEPLRRQVLWVGEGRSREAIRPFFEALDEAARRRIKAVVMDMNTAYDLEVRAHCRNAEVVYDLFHVVAKYGREVIDRVRVDEANRLRQDRRARRQATPGMGSQQASRSSGPSVAGNDSATGPSRAGTRCRSPRDPLCSTVLHRPPPR